MLERAVVGGRIRAYGIATWNGPRVAATDAGHLSLERARELAHDAAGDNGGDHFRFLQLPLSLAQPQAFGQAVQAVGEEVLAPVAAAGRLGLWPVASGAIGQGRIGDLDPKLAAYLGPADWSTAQRALQFTRSAPGLAAALVGMKRDAHVAENFALGEVPILDEARFRALFAKG